MLERAKRHLAHPRMPAFAVLVAVVLLLPALGAGFFADDITHQLLFRPDFELPGGPRGDWDLFRFIGPDRNDFQRSLDIGFWPWWAAPTLRIAFLRPISALLHALDYRLLPGLPAIMHAESLALYAAIVLAAALLYRRVLGPTWVAGLAALLFAVDDAHSLTVVWIANRNALVAGVFSFFALLAHDRARRDGHRPSLVLAPVLFGLGLLGGEAAVAALAYLVAYALWLDPAPLRDRARSLAPYALATAAYAAAYKGFGYGTEGSGFYIDPVGEPAEFARALALRLPQLLLAQLAAPTSEMWSLLSADRAAGLLVAGALATTGILAALAAVLWRDRTARFLATGMVLALVPVCATWPNDRLLLFSSLGAFGLVSLFFARMSEVTGRAARASLGAVAAVFLLFHVVLAPPLLPLRAHAFATMYSAYVERADRSLGRGAPPAMLVVVTAPDILVTGYVGGVRILRGEPISQAVRQLASAVDGNDGELERIDERTIAITLERGFVDDSFAKVVRGASVPFRQGDVVRTRWMTAEVAELTADARPRRVVFRFDRPLEDPSLGWVTWQGTGYVPVELPAPGNKVPIASTELVRAVMDR